MYTTNAEPLHSRNAEKRSQEILLMSYVTHTCLKLHRQTSKTLTDKTTQIYNTTKKYNNIIFFTQVLKYIRMSDENMRCLIYKSDH